MSYAFMIFFSDHSLHIEMQLILCIDLVSRLYKAILEYDNVGEASEQTVGGTLV